MFLRLAEFQNALEGVQCLFRVLLGGSLKGGKTGGRGKLGEKITVILQFQVTGLKASAQLAKLSQVVSVRDGTQMVLQQKAFHGAFR